MLSSFFSSHKKKLLQADSRPGERDEKEMHIIQRGENFLRLFNSEMKLRMATMKP